MTSHNSDDAHDATTPSEGAIGDDPVTVSDGSLAESDGTPVESDGTPESIWDNPPESPLPDGYYTDGGVPTFDAVRARIEERIATADGHEELDTELPQERDFRKEQEDLKRAGAERLEQLRKSMGLDK